MTCKTKCTGWCPICIQKVQEEEFQRVRAELAADGADQMRATRRIFWLCAAVASAPLMAGLRAFRRVTGRRA
jgi:hypothetical protein